MEWVETSARTEAEAVDAALDQLGVDESELEYEVLAKKSGFLGRFGVETRIRARVKPISREKPGEKRRRSKGRGDGSPRSARPRNGDTRRQEPKAASSSAQTADSTEAGDRPAGGGNKRRRRRRSSGSGGGAAVGTIDAGTTTGITGERSAESSAERPARNPGNRPATNGDTVDEQTDVAIEDQAASAVDFVKGLLEAFGASGAVQFTIDDDFIHVDVEGSDLGLLVGPKGATLASVEELTRTVVQRRTGGHGARINVDVAGYRAKRREALSAFTRTLIEKVRESGKELALEPMGAADRKVVHDTVAEVEGFSTISEGEEPRRRVVIQPS
ncbi:MAG: putative RNA-binding protein [Actinomycetia bacterium]|nr:putative RNA-binding protein [Actinomycetes bacterium]